MILKTCCQWTVRIQVATSKHTSIAGRNRQTSIKFELITSNSIQNYTRANHLALKAVRSWRVSCFWVPIPSTIAGIAAQTWMHCMDAAGTYLTPPSPPSSVSGTGFAICTHSSCYRSFRKHVVAPFHKDRREKVYRWTPAPKAWEEIHVWALWGKRKEKHVILITLSESAATYCN